MSRQFAVCHTCLLKHLSAPGSDEASEFFQRHRNHDVELIAPDPILAKLQRVLGVDLFREVARGLFELDRVGHVGYAGNASVKQAFGTATAFTKTNANLPSSPTAGWASNAIDNSANLYDDALVGIELAAVNTSPAANKAIYLYGFGLIHGTNAYTSTGDGVPSGSEAALTFPDISSLPVGLPLAGVVPYPVLNKAINGGPFSVARCFGGIMPVKWGLAMINYSGMTLNVTNIYYIEAYYTVA